MRARPPMHLFLAPCLAVLALAACASAPAPPPVPESSASVQLTQALAADSDTIIALAYLRSGDAPAAYRTLEEGMYANAVLAAALVREPDGSEISDALRRTALCHLWRIRAYRDAYPPDYDWPGKARAMAALDEIPASPAVPPQCKELMQVQ